MDKSITELIEKIREGGQAYSSNYFTAEEIEKARRMGNFYVDEDGFGFIHSPINYREITNNMRSEFQKIWKTLRDAKFQPACNTGCVAPDLSDVISQLVEWNQKVEKVRNVFRAELEKKGYSESDIRNLISF